jgi:hypothetical protein
VRLDVRPVGDSVRVELRLGSPDVGVEPVEIDGDGRCVQLGYLTCARILSVDAHRNYQMNGFAELSSTAQGVC